MSESRRTSVMLAKSNMLLCKYFTMNQRKILYDLVNSNKFCTGLTGPNLGELEGPYLGESTKNCVYLWRRKEDSWCHVGITQQERSVRDNQHVRESKSFFDQQVKDREEWDIVTICQYGGSVEGRRDEPLHEIMLIILLNTSARREKQMGFNNDLGGRYNSTIVQEE